MHLAELDAVPSKKALAIELFVLSCSSLFFELLIIRWLGCDWMPFIVFKTFPLVTCFVGLGVGISKAQDKYFAQFPLALLGSIFIIFMLTSAGINLQAFPAAGLYQWEDITGNNLNHLVQTVLMLTAAVVAVLAGPFAVMFCLGNRIGSIFNQFRPLNAYCIDISGAIFGSICFGLMSFLRASPAIQMVVFCVLVLAFLLRRLKNPISGALCVLVAVVLAFLSLSNARTAKTAWTPYYCLKLEEFKVPDEFLQPGQSNPPAIHISVNNAFMQAFTPNNYLQFKPEALKNQSAKWMDDLLTVRRNYYALPYTFEHPKEVLVLGAGSGSDVAAALKDGAESVDAVEIDPVVIELGRKYNPAYQSPKVHIYCADARHYVNHCHKKYDMVLFGCLDSLGLVGLSSMRTDSYIHTAQSYKQCLSLLQPDGLFIVSFGAGTGKTEWLRNKIFLTIRSAAGYDPLVITDQHATHKWPAYVFVSGNPVRDHKIQPPQAADSFNGVSMPPNPEGRVITDDWPYLYVKPIGLDIPYMFVLMIVMAITVYCGRGLIFAKGNSSVDWQLFFLGSAFMLLELQAISRLSLLYGTTWLTASVVINGVLLMILAANAIVFKFGSLMRQSVLYAMLIASLLLSYFLPVNELLNAGGTLGGNVIVTALTLLPMFVAGLVFATAYSVVTTPARSFAFNLLGSVAGALLEYASTYTGINSLVLIAVALYSLSWICYASGRKSISATSLAAAVSD